jgi:NAD(P)-dependent dehydrogenase (short-subunit alcohol dehydrogenase family)
VSGLCEGRVVVVTGAGGGIGREYALGFARAGAKVVVNDLGGARDGSGDGSSAAAQAVVDDIIAAGGEAAANGDDVSSWDGAKHLIEQATDTYGRLDVLVNNAGILRDKMLVNMDESDWDSVLKVHLKGTFAPCRHAAEYWRGVSKAGGAVDGRIINTTSPSGLFGNVGQANYGSAKAGIAGLTVILSMELGRYGVTVNAIAPTALTRLTEDVAFMQQLSRPDEYGFDEMSPANIAPVVVWLGSERSKDITGRVFSVWGGRLAVLEGWAAGPRVDKGATWQLEELDDVIPDLVAKAAPNANGMGDRA